MNEDEIERWITVNGQHIPIKSGQTADEAIKERQIAHNKKEADKKNAEDKKYHFPDSKVHTSVYHGSNKDFDKFDSSKSIEGNDAIFFSESSDYAESMAEERNGNLIYEVELNIKNPYEVSLPNKEFGMPRSEKKYIEYAREHGYDGVIFKNAEPDEYSDDTFYAVFSSDQIFIKNKRKF